MNYKELAEAIMDMTEEQQNSEVTIQDPDDELIPVKQLHFSDGALDGRLNDDHPVLIV